MMNGVIAAMIAVNARPYLLIFMGFIMIYVRCLFLLLLQNMPRDEQSGKQI